ncbi:maltodextrin phosphorylase, partial [Microbacterium sp. SUBG005]
FAGTTETYDDDGVERSRWVPEWNVLAVPYNMMVPGYHNGRVNTLRLWRAVATNAFDLHTFNSGDYVQSVRAQTFAENISKVLYPEDSTPQGKELRLQQQYFFVAASIADFIENVLPADFDLEKLPERVIFQLNDTHPRHRGCPSSCACSSTRRSSNGMPRGRSRRSASRTRATRCCRRRSRCGRSTSSAALLPRHLEIIYKINDAFL